MIESKSGLVVTCQGLPCLVPSSLLASIRRHARSSGMVKQHPCAKQAARRAAAAALRQRTLPHAVRAHAKSEMMACQAAAPPGQGVTWKAGVACAGSSALKLVSSAAACKARARASRLARPPSLQASACRSNSSITDVVA